MTIRSIRELVSEYKILGKPVYPKNSIDSCDYIPIRPKNFAVLLKGASLENLPDYISEFHHCFIVSDYNDELKIVGEDLLGKNITHFTNRSKQASLSKDNYLKYGISNIQLGQVFRYDHVRLMESKLHYALMAANLKTHYLPEKLLSYHRGLGEEYRFKFPNTGIISLIYALEMIRPVNLWVFGLDFYSAPYMTKQTQGTPLTLDQQAGKMGRLDLMDYVYQLFSSFPETNINMVSYYKNWPKISNMSSVL